MPLIISACEEIEREEANLHEEFIVSEPPPHIVLYSFGQPKAGNAAFAAMVRPYIHTYVTSPGSFPCHARSAIKVY